MKIEHKDGVFWRSYQFATGETLHLLAKDVRRERTGIHAQIKTYLDKTPLPYTTLNVEGKDEDRTKYANSVHKALQRIAEIATTDYKADHLKRDLDLFCTAVPEAWEATRIQVERYDLDEPLPSIDFLLRPYVLDGGGTLFFAPPGSGKSWLNQLMGACIGSGNSHYWPVQKRPVLYANLERSRDSVKRRFLQIGRLLDLPRKDHGVDFLHARGMGFSSLEREVKAWRRANPNGVGILDSISRAGMGDLTKNEVANSIIDFLSASFHTWMGIAHTPRASEEHQYGSVMYDAGEDIGVKVVGEERELASGNSATHTLGVSMQIVKGNDIAKGGMQLIAFDFKRDGEDSILHAIRRPSSSEFPELAAGRSITRIEKIRLYLLSTGEATVTQIAKAIGQDPGNISRLLASSNEFVRLPKQGRSVLYAVKEQTLLP